MTLELLRIYNARNLKEYSLTPHPFFNIIYGSNGVGKTTVLECIYLLLRSKTYRSSKYKSFIQSNTNTCSVFSKFSNTLTDKHSSTFTLGISRSRDSSQPLLHLNSKKINSLSTITNLVVLGLITPESFTLLDSGPAIRRKFIDWGVFHVEPDFFNNWRSYKKVLSNRNATLKQLGKYYKSINEIPKNRLDNIRCWSPQMISLNNSLNAYRKNQIRNITPFFYECLKLFSLDLARNISIYYYQGWSNELSYEEYLNNKLAEDFSAGTTRYGTHRAELRINYTNSPAKDILSRGQKKIVVICLILAQFNYLVNQDNDIEHHLLLLDDIDSELDNKNLKILFDILTSLQTQIIITTTDQNKFDFIDKKNHKLFHVKQ